jgi:hypothetical protein
MGIRVRKSIKIMPGVRLNISKSGVSTSIGVKGATVNLKPGRKPRTTVGILGTSLSCTTSGPAERPRSAQAAAQGVSLRRTGRLLGILTGTLGLAFCQESLILGVMVLGCSTALYLACKHPPNKQDTPD